MICPECKSNNIYIHFTNSKPETFTHRYMHCIDCGSTWQMADTMIPGTFKSRFYNTYEPNLFDGFKNGTNSINNGDVTMSQTVKKNVTSTKSKV